ncbi:MAG: UdgX family uracil-DNA binding protein [Phycisphaerae bacterium]
MVGSVVEFDGTFEGWRGRARELARRGVSPERVEWRVRGEGGSLFDANAVGLADEGVGPTCTVLRVPGHFVELARAVACFRDEGKRWGILYRLLWRLTHGEPELLKIAVDEDVWALSRMEKAVRRDAHKMRAFVRFREVRGEDGGREFVAFHRPEHLVLPLVTDFFVDRFHDMRWTIVTPDGSVRWDRERVEHGPGAGRGVVAGDEVEEFWKTYYSHIFNPARVRVRAMRKEMPVRYWGTMPETAVIGGLLREAPARVEAMIERTREAARSAENFLPACGGGGAGAGGGRAYSLEQLQEAARGCRGCGICEMATQTVFGEGPATARLVIVGEQPGDQEDVAGRPFVGPAGQLLSLVMERAGLKREEVYVTNAVKHFKWEADPRGNRRLHQKPGWTEVTACRPWLTAELEAIRPAMILGLGVTAGQTLIGPEFRLGANRGKVFGETGLAPWVTVTIHPSALLRMPAGAMRERELAAFEHDLRVVAERLKQVQAEAGANLHTAL